MPQRRTLTDDRLSDDTVKHPPVPDETVRMRADGPAPDGGPALRPVDGSRRHPPGDPRLAARRTGPRPGASRTPAPSVARPSRPRPRPTTGTPRRSTARPTSTPRATTRTTRPPTLSAVPDEVRRRRTGHSRRPPAGDEPPGLGLPRPWWRRRAVLVPAGAVAVLAGAYGGDLLLSSGDIPRSTVVAGVDIGGLSPADAATHPREEAGAAGGGRPHRGRRRRAVRPRPRRPPASRSTSTRTVDAADDQPLNPWTRLTTLFGDREVDPVIGTDADRARRAARGDRHSGRPRTGGRHDRHRRHDPERGRSRGRPHPRPRRAPPRPSPPRSPPVRDPTTPIELPVDVAHGARGQGRGPAGARRDRHARRCPRR